MFSRLSFLQRSLIALVALLIALCFALPWGLYALGLQHLGGRPDRPQAIISQDQQQKLWAGAGFGGAPELTELSPVSYILGAAGQDAPPPVTLFAWRVSSAYLHQHRLFSGDVLQQQLAGGALTVWLTRHWTLEEILSRVAELERQQPSPGHQATAADTATGQVPAPAPASGQPPQ